MIEEAAVDVRWGTTTTWLRGVAAILLGCCCLWLAASFGDRPATQAPRASGLDALPLAARGPVSEALGGGDRRFWVRRADGGFAAMNGGQRFAVRFSRFGATLVAGSRRVSLGLAGVGYGGRLRGLALVAPVARRNRVAFGYGALSQWFVNGPLGLEQGFTLRSPPAGARRGPFTIALRVSGSLTPRLARGRGTVDFTGAGGRVVLRYAGLEAFDARGRALRAWLAQGGGRLLIRIDDRGARYPLRIDPFVQEGSKLAASNGTENGAGFFGYDVALSADGSTALIGGYGDNGFVGAAWVFTRSGATWSQQQKLTAASGTESGIGYFGSSVALSADGNTALIGGQRDGSLSSAASSGVGAAWVFTRSGATWSQQQKLTASGGTEIGKGDFGSSVALSADGSDALIGGLADNSYVGAAWVFSRSGSTWSQQQKLTASGGSEIGSGQFGSSVALLTDASTAVIGGNADNSGVGAAWAFSRSGSSWSQQQRLTATAGSETGSGFFGISVALSADGSTALVGGPGDNSSAGAAWVFTRSGSTWSQQQRLTASGGSEIGSGQLGSSVALSAAGSNALIGGNGDNNFAGAAWVFSRSGSTWSQQQKLTAASGTETGGGDFGFSAALSADGSTALIGGQNDSGFLGAAWVFVPGRTLGVSLAGTGSGAVTGSGISCPGGCVRLYPTGAVVSLTATPAAGSTFVGWGGACSGTGVCTVTLDSDQAVTATFKLGAPKISKAKIDHKHHKATFKFNAGAATGTQCALIKKPKKHKKAPKPHFSSCTSPKTYKPLKNGKYTFEARALSNGSAGPAAKRQFTI